MHDMSIYTMLQPNERNKYDMFIELFRSAERIILRLIETKIR